MARSYWTLFTREPGCNWSISFGDYEKSVVVQERIDSYRDYRSADWAIVKTEDTQASVEAAAQRLDETR